MLITSMVPDVVCWLLVNSRNKQIERNDKTGDHWWGNIFTFMGNMPHEIIKMV